jgi:hypothetical protein
VLDNPASSTDGIFPRNTPVSSIQLNNAIVQKVNVSKLENAERQGVLLLHANTVLLGKTLIRQYCFSSRLCLPADTWVSPI